MNITVNVDQVDLTTTIGEHTVDYGDGDYSREPRTLGDAVAEQVARDLQKDDAYRSLRKRFIDLRDEEIREQIRPIVAKAITDPVQKTNGYGQPVGEPVSLTELIVGEVRTLLSKRDGYDRSTPTFVQKIIRDEVGRTLTAELQQVIADEKAKVVAAVRAQAAELIADAVKKGIGAR